MTVSHDDSRVTYGIADSYDLAYQGRIRGGLTREQAIAQATDAAGQAKHEVYVCAVVPLRPGVERWRPVLGVCAEAGAITELRPGTRRRMHEGRKDLLPPCRHVTNDLPMPTGGRRMWLPNMDQQELRMYWHEVGRLRALGTRPVEGGVP